MPADLIIERHQGLLPPSREALFDSGYTVRLEIDAATLSTVADPRSIHGSRALFPSKGSLIAYLATLGVLQTTLAQRLDAMPSGGMCRLLLSSDQTRLLLQRGFPGE